MVRCIWYWTSLETVTLFIEKSESFTKKIPTLGICFGHQLIALTLGGKIKFHSRGTEIGTVKINLTTEGDFFCGDLLMNKDKPAKFEMIVSSDDFENSVSYLGLLFTDQKLVDRQKEDSLTEFEKKSLHVIPILQ